jgi:transposase
MKQIIPNETFAKIKELLSQGLSQRDVARMVGVSQYTVYRSVNPVKEKKETETFFDWNKVNCLTSKY